jgi:hypothetical protein
MSAFKYFTRHYLCHAALKQLMSQLILINPEVALKNSFFSITTISDFFVNIVLLRVARRLFIEEDIE